MVAALQADRVEPELRFAVVPLDVDVGRLAPVAGVEEEPERPAAEYRRPAPMLSRPACENNSGRGKPRREGLMLDPLQKPEPWPVAQPAVAFPAIEEARQGWSLAPG